MRLVLALLLLMGAAPAVARAETAQEIVAASDRVRNPGQPFRSTSTLTELIGGKQRDQNVLVIYSKEDPATRQFRNLVRYMAPPRDQGKTVLLDGHVLWFYDPNSKSSVRISAQQRLVGQAAIGDVLTVNLAIDYAGALLGDETIQDADRQSRTCWHLDLKAANDQSTYTRVEYWVEHASFHPIKVKFYSDSGRLMKILYYRSFTQRLDRMRPAEAIIIDAVDTSLVTTVKFGEIEPRDIPEAWFQRDYLPRLPAE
jgi:outer membrane lipoprotein-sorting protein